MSIVKRHDIVQTGLYMANEKKHLHALEEGKAGWVDMPSKEREVVVECLHKLEVNSIRQHANLGVDHQKMLKAEFTETLTTEMGKRSGQGFLSNKGRKLCFKVHNPTPDPDSDTADKYSQVFFITPSSLSGFEALRAKYQYFKINKISAKFVANTANNLSPIICKYLPPMAKVANLDDLSKAKLDSSFITKYAESKGSEYGFISIHCPPCLVKLGEYTKQDKEEVFSFGDNGMCLPGLCKDRCICDYKEQNQYLDYGYLYFETRNQADYQSVVIQLHYYIDFYTGYDFEAASIGVSFGPGANEEGGDDDNLPNEGEDENVPDTTPSGRGPYPRGGIVKKTFGKK